MEAVDVEDTQPPIRATRGRIRAPRLRPGQQDRLRDAKLDLGARYRIETDESLILQQFFEEQFESWLEEKLAPGDAEPAKKKGGRR